MKVPCGHLGEGPLPAHPLVLAPPCSEATFQDENRPGSGFAGRALPDLACSEWNSVMGSAVTLSQLEQAWEHRAWAGHTVRS